MADPRLAAMIAAVQFHVNIEDEYQLSPSHIVNLRATLALLEALADREALRQAIKVANMYHASDPLPAAFLATLLARAGGG